VKREKGILPFLTFTSTMMGKNGVTKGGVHRFRGVKRSQTLMGEREGNLCKKIKMETSIICVINCCRIHRYFGGK